MALGLQTANQDFDPYIKYDARAGRWSRKGKEGEDATVDITDNFAAVFDFTSIEVGWLLFAPGAGPVYVTRPVALGLPPKPPGDHKQGFKMRIVLAQHCGGGVHELASTAKAAISVIDTIHTAYEAAPEAKQGKLPVYAMRGTQIVESKSPQGVTRNYAPRLELVQWVDRPASLDAGSAQKVIQFPEPAPRPAATAPAATGSKPAAAPVKSNPDMQFG